ncbi:isoprenoid synthase domain-containing protein [Aspergillus lucknowensis]|uniref:Isoprenoid synthase domain-containing protein n=1 Tax=Aspergillus lucknowensis TaxID=176173 RepID=A0ABR4LYG8_9EURO
MLLQAIYEVPEGERGKLPQGFSENSQTEGRSDKAEAIVSTAVNAAIYLNPESSPTRIALISKVFLLAWLQDDVVEFDSSGETTTAVDIIIREWPEIVTNPEINLTSPTTISASIAHELICESPVLGREVMKGLLAFIFSQPRKEFSGFRDFLDYRAVNVAAELSPGESSVLDKFLQLAYDHLLLVNDLYSFEKEKREFEEQGATISNAVYYLESTLSVHPNTAKLVALDVIHQTEAQLSAEFSKLRSNGLSQQQLKYACAILECTAGNIVYSLTAKREDYLLG